jgi:uncharacterized protein
MRKLLSLTWLAIGLLSASCSTASNDNSRIPKKISGFPQPTGYVNDFDFLLTKEEEAQLTDIIKKHEQETTDQIAIVTLDTFDTYEKFEKYTLDLANYWGVGQKGKNNGILIGVSQKSRWIRIQNGYGIEKRLSDEETKRIIDDEILPEFKSENYYEGLRKGLLAIIAELK